MDKVVQEALNDLRIGEAKLEFEGDKIDSNNIQTVLLQEKPHK